ncbi:MAG: hypothetical protein HYZ40_03220 [Rhodospirillales bacterium]|nr:hypothetical protein [Rhodospirillales bacterium]
MSILDSLLGGGNQSTEVSGAVAANPGLALQASDVLHVLGAGPVAELTGIGDLGLAVQAPIAAAADVSTSSSSSTDDGGLLSGLL